MNLYKRDLRNERLDFVARLPASCKLLVVAFYVFASIGVTAFGAYALHYWKGNRDGSALQDDLLKAKAQEEMLELVTVQLHKRRELIVDIQAWLSQRYDLEAIYHQCVNLVPRGTLVESFSVQHHASRSTLAFKIGVGGDANSYNGFFRALTGYFTTAPDMKVADIQLTSRPQGALLAIEVLLDEEIAAIAPKLTQHEAN